MPNNKKMGQHSDRFISTLTKNTVAIILAGGRGSRRILGLQILKARRC